MRRAHLAVLTIFLLHGLGTGMWIARIPAVQERLGLGVGALGLALLGAGVGTLLAMIPAGALVARHGSRAVVRWSVLPAAGALPLIAAAGDGLSLFASLVVFGAGFSALDVAMNAQGSAVEGRLGRPIMSSLHGLWSVGSMAGAAVGAFLAGAGVGVQAHLLAAAPLLLAGVLLAGRWLAAGDEGKGGTVLARPRGALLALAVVAFCAVTTEGAMFDWAGVYLRRTLDAPEAAAASAASFFSAAMAAGRLSGDMLTARLSPVWLARGGATLAGLGVAAIVLAPAAPAVFGGLVMVGLGLSVLVPLAFGAAGRSQDMPAGAAIAAVATVSYFGFLVGPPTIGLVAEQITLRGALALLLGLLGLIVLLAPAIGGEPARRRAAAAATPRAAEAPASGSASPPRP